MLVNNEIALNFPYSTAVPLLFFLRRRVHSVTHTRSVPLRVRNRRSLPAFSRIPKRRDKLPLTNKTPIPKRKKEIKKDSAHGEDDDDVLCAAPGEQQRQWRLSPGSWKRSRRASLFMHQCGDAAITIYHQRDVHHASHRRARRKNMMMGISIRPAPQGA